MCNRCHEYVVKEMDIKDTDLPNLPYTEVKWFCIFEGCPCGNKKVRDYGLPGYLFDPTKRRTTKHGWKGGWFSVSNHYRACSRHWVLIKRKAVDWPDFSEENAKSKFKPIDKVSKPKKKKKLLY